MTTEGPLRIGVLGAARIAPMALIRPAQAEPTAHVTAVAARSPARAADFARRHGIPVVHESYAALLADPEIDAVYIPLPNGLHGKWTVAAVRAGKHVLCEKPFTANAAEAEVVAKAARSAGRVVMEAFHYRYHPLIARVLEVVGSGELGDVARIEGWFHIPLLPVGDIRWDLSLAGGAVMDVGCYPVHLLRTVAGAEPAARWASARQRRPGVDRSMQAELSFPDGRTGSISASMLSRRLLGSGARVIGSSATLTVVNPFHPHLFHRMAIRRRRGAQRVERVARQPSTYAAQLRAFTRAVLEDAPIATGVDDAVANMQVIDDLYTAAGLPLRAPTP